MADTFSYISYRTHTHTYSVKGEIEEGLKCSHIMHIQYHSSMGKCCFVHTVFTGGKFQSISRNLAWKRHTMAPSEFYYDLKINLTLEKHANAKLHITDL